MSMTKDILLAATAMGCFIICPRMAAMVHIVSKHTHTPLYIVALLGTLISIPLMLGIVWTFNRYGVPAAIGFCVGTDIIAALILTNAGWKAPLETTVIAGFVLAGVKVAPLISRMVVQ
jgi:hypothetical protein